MVDPSEASTKARVHVECLGGYVSRRYGDPLCRENSKENRVLWVKPGGDSIPSRVTRG